MLTDNQYQQLIDEFKEKALSASLYQSPADILFTGVALLCDGFYSSQSSECHAPAASLSFAACVSNNHYSTPCRWETAYGEVDKLQQLAGVDPGVSIVVDDHEIKASLAAVLSARSQFSCMVKMSRVEAHIGEKCEALCRYILDAWQSLIDEYGEEICLGLGYKNNNHHLPHIEEALDTQLSRTVSIRLREGLQRIEDELPLKYRSEDERCQLEFIWRHSFQNRDFAEGHDRPAYLATHEDIRFLDSCMDADPSALINALSPGDAETNRNPSHSAGLAAMADDRWVEAFREQYERPLDKLAYGADDVIAKSLLLGIPLFDRHKPSPSILNQLHITADKNNGINRLIWPVYIMGKPQFLVILSLNLQDVLADNNDAFADLMELIRGMLRIQEVAWSVLFDIYHDVLIEMFGDVYLAALRRMLEKKTKPSFADYTIDTMNRVTSWLGSIFNLHTLSWSKPIRPDCKTLYDLHNEVELGEIKQPNFQLSDEEAMRLAVLQEQQDNLKAIALNPLFTGGDTVPERYNMFHHIAWRLGYYVRYQLPELLMTLRYSTEYALERERSILRHEMGGLINSSRRLLNDLADDKGENLSDLKLLMRLLQRTVDGTGQAGRRIEYYLPDCHLNLGTIFASLRRLFQSKFRIETEKGILGKAEIILLSHEENTLQLNIAEEDIYGFWRNLWDNARKVVIDYSRETPGGERVDRRREILKQHGPYSLRCRKDDSPAPEILCVIYQQEVAGNTCVCLDMLDNAPRLAGGVIDYPDEAAFGHYGLGLLYEMARGLSGEGLNTRFNHPRPLSAEQARFYQQQASLCQYQWNTPEHWSISSVQFEIKR